MSETSDADDDARRMHRHRAWQDEEPAPPRSLFGVNWGQAITSAAVIASGSIFAFQWSLNARLTAIEIKDANREASAVIDRSGHEALKLTVEHNSNRLTVLESHVDSKEKEIEAIHLAVGKIDDKSNTCSNGIVTMQASVRYLEDEVRIIKNQLSPDRFQPSQPQREHEFEHGGRVQ